MIHKHPLLEYIDNSRGYHSIVHIGKMIEDLHRYFPAHADDYELKMAILYHDAVYEAGAVDNEFRSAVAFKEDMESRFDNIKDGPIREVQRLIMLTKNHVTTPEDRIGAVLIDLDLAGLGKSRDVYIMNSKLVKQEYLGITDEQWKFGRIAFIDSFVARGNIYQTPEGRANWEIQARDNLLAEKDYLMNS